MRVAVVESSSMSPGIGRKKKLWWSPAVAGVDVVRAGIRVVDSTDHLLEVVGDEELRVVARVGVGQNVPVHRRPLVTDRDSVDLDQIPVDDDFDVLVRRGAAFTRTVPVRSGEVVPALAFDVLDRDIRCRLADNLGFELVFPLERGCEFLGRDVLEYGRGGAGDARLEDLEVRARDIERLPD